MEKEIIAKYDKIILELLVIMVGALIYLVLAKLWIVAVFWGALVLSGYMMVKREKRRINELAKNTLKL